MRGSRVRSPKSWHVAPRLFLDAWSANPRAPPVIAWCKGCVRGVGEKGEGLVHVRHAKKEPQKCQNAGADIFLAARKQSFWPRLFAPRDARIGRQLVVGIEGMLVMFGEGWWVKRGGGCMCNFSKAGQRRRKVRGRTQAKSKSEPTATSFCFGEPQKHPDTQATCKPQANERACERVWSTKSAGQQRRQNEKKVACFLGPVQRMQRRKEGRGEASGVARTLILPFRIPPCLSVILPRKACECHSDD